MHESLAHSEMSSLVWAKQRLGVDFIIREESGRKILHRCEGSLGV